MKRLVPQPGLLRDGSVPVTRRACLKLGAALGAGLLTRCAVEPRSARARDPMGLMCTLRDDTVDLLMHYAWYTPGNVWTTRWDLAKTHYPALNQKNRFLVAISLAGLRTIAARSVGQVVYDGLAYNPEINHTPPGEIKDIPAAMARARAIADHFGKRLVASPGGKLMFQHPEWYTPVAQLCDVYHLQSGGYQELGMPAYRDAIEGIVAQLLGRECWVQLNVVTSGNPWPAELLFDYAQAIADLVRGIDIYDHRDPNRPETLAQVFSLVAGP